MAKQLNIFNLSIDMMYNKKVFRHYNNPHNKGRLDKTSFVFEGKNPFCGDDIIIDIEVNENNIITDVSWEGKGCAISQAAASLFTEEIKNKNLDEIKTWDNKLILDLVDIDLSPSRVKCALLPLYAIKGIDVEEM